MNLNPEFRRNMWLELTPHRVVMMPAVLGALFLLVAQFDARGLGPVVGHVALGLALLMAVAWGGYQAGEAILDELRRRTWDSQRMSALRPWPMAWGKLLGATVFSWYGCLLCLLVYVAGNRDAAAGILTRITLAVAASGLLVQSVNLMVALTSARLVRTVKGTHGLVTIMSTLILLWVSYDSYFGTDAPIVWYGHSTPVLDFVTASAVMFACWTVLGVHRMLCLELQVPTLPWAWVAFVCYLTAFIGGAFTNAAWSPRDILAVLADIGLGVSIAATYLSAFTSYRDRLVLRRVGSYFRGRQWRRTFEELPLWLVSAGLAAMFAAICSMTSSVSLMVPARMLGPAALGFWLLMVRDVLILLFFSYSSAARRPALTAIIYLALLHWLIPAILTLSGLVRLSWLVSPPVTDRPAFALLVIVAHVALAATLAWRRYGREVAPNPLRARIAPDSAA